MFLLRFQYELVLCFCLGFSTIQAEVMVSMLVRTTHSNMDAIYSDMATKVQQV